MSNPLTLIVAATPKWGIGKGGSLPWPLLKEEMAYFARVTRRAPPSPCTSRGGAPKSINAVIMGRKTWESIPTKSRPLKGRINVVLSRSLEFLESLKGDAVGEFPQEGPIAATSIANALVHLEGINSRGSSGLGTLAPRLGRVFVIGGAELYNLAVRLNICDRILLTRVEGDWDCDTFFPLRLAEPKEGNKNMEWKKLTAKELGDWIGEDLGDTRREEGGIGWQWEMWIREQD